MEERMRYSAAAIERAIRDGGAAALSERLSEGWGRECLDTWDAGALRLAIPLLDLPRVRDRAATVLFAVGCDWPEALEAADAPGCGFTRAFWRDAFEVAQDAGATRCVSWLLARKGRLLSDGPEGLEL